MTPMNHGVARRAMRRIPPLETLPNLPKPLRDGAIVGLGVPIAYPDAELYGVVKGWSKEHKAPARIGVFPDTAAPDFEDVAAMRAATKRVGRWVRPGKAKRSFLEELGFSAAEAETWQREASPAIRRA